MDRQVNLQAIEIEGEVSIEPVPETFLLSRWEHLYLLMGPTGSGKSTFIEALAGNVDLGISKDQLEGYTQSISVYKVVNARLKDEYSTDHRPREIYLLDCPGFSDARISHMEIIQMVDKWTLAQDPEQKTKVPIDGIIYTCPISDSRIAGTRKRAIKLLKSMADMNKHNMTPLIDLPCSSAMVTVATTMWDTMWKEEQIRRCNKRYQQLKDEIWKDLLEHGGSVTKFLNTSVSALETLDRCICDYRRASYLYLSLPDYDHRRYQVGEYGKNLYQDLLDRVENQRQRIRILEADLAQPEVQSDELLLAINKTDLMDANHLFSKFTEELYQFGDPPPGFEHIVIPWRYLSVKGRVRQGSYMARKGWHSIMNRDMESFAMNSASS